MSVFPYKNNELELIDLFAQDGLVPFWAQKVDSWNCRTEIDRG